MVESLPDRESGTLGGGKRERERRIAGEEIKRVKEESCRNKGVKERERERKNKRPFRW